MDVDDAPTPDPFDLDGTPSTRVVSAVAWIKGVDPTALKPLHEVVDVGAMDRLVDADRWASPTVYFEYEGYEIEIDGGRSITLRGSSDPTLGPLPPGMNALVLAPRHSEHEEAACNGLLSTASDADNPDSDGDEPYAHVNVLGVTFDLVGSDPLDRWHVEANEPRRVGLLSVGESTRSSAARPSPASSEPDQPVSRPPTFGPVRIDTVPDPSDLQAIGMRINELLSAWDEPDVQSVLCFHSVSNLLDASALEDVFRFLHLLGGWLSSKGAIAHFHLDSRGHDEQTVNTLRPLFDVVFEVETDGSWAIHLP